MLAWSISPLTALEIDQRAGCGGHLETLSRVKIRQDLFRNLVATFM